MRAVDLLRGVQVSGWKGMRSTQRFNIARRMHKLCNFIIKIVGKLRFYWQRLKGSECNWKYWTQVSSAQWEDYGIPSHACQRAFTSYQILPDNKRYESQLHWLFKLRLLRQLLTYLPYSPSMKCNWERGIIQSDCSYLLLLLFSLLLFPALLSRLT